MSHSESKATEPLPNDENQTIDLTHSPETSVTSTIKPKETGGPAGPEPTRFGDWERKGRCIDF